MAVLHAIDINHQHSRNVDGAWLSRIAIPIYGTQTLHYISHDVCSLARSTCTDLCVCARHDANGDTSTQHDDIDKIRWPQMGKIHQRKCIVILFLAISLGWSEPDELVCCFSYICMWYNYCNKNISILWRTDGISSTSRCSRRSRCDLRLALPIGLRRMLINTHVFSIF